MSNCDRQRRNDVWLPKNFWRYKPKRCPQGLSLDEFDALPSAITVREVY
ncbi:MAG: hypothetical protein V7L20_23025 [Nostoc sp.]